jgi:hypothetical protein
MKMNALRSGAAAAGLLALLGAPALPAHAQTPPCQFRFGFATLARGVGSEAGDCQEEQRYTADGNAEQRTTTGLLVWRKRDNWTAFTDGYRTWINGPRGLEVRLNTERFPWEPDATAPGTTVIAPAPAPAEPAPLVAGTQLGLPVTGPTLQFTALAFERVAPRGAGTREVKVRVKVEPGKNNGPLGKYDYWDFRLRSPEGVEYRPSAVTPSRPGGLSTGTITRDQFVIGDLYFEVPDDGGGFGLHFYPSGHANPSVAISRWIGGTA